MKAKFYYPPTGDWLELWIWDKAPGDKLYLMVVKDGEVHFDLCTPGEDHKPTLRFTGLWSGEILKALAEALDDHGIKTDSDAKIEGKLRATEYHLEDMRSLLGLRGKTDQKPYSR